MSRSKRLSYGLAIGLAATGLLVDRLAGLNVTSVPPTASGAPTAASGPPAARVPVPDEPEESRPWARMMVVRTYFPTHLPSYDGQLDQRDVFALTPVIRDTVLRSTPEPLGAAATLAPGSENDEGRAAGFRQRHRLSAVMLEGEAGYAIVVPAAGAYCGTTGNASHQNTTDGEWIQVGAFLDGCTLTRLEGDGAFFECPDGEVQLSVDSEETGS